MFDSSMLVLGAANPVAVMLCLLVVVLPIGLLIGAVILRASVSLFNKFAGFKPGVFAGLVCNFLSDPFFNAPHHFQASDGSRALSVSDCSCSGHCDWSAFFTCGNGNGSGLNK